MIKHQQNEDLSSSSGSSHSHSVVVSFVDSRGSITKFVSREEDFEKVDEDVILENCDETVFRPVVTVFSEFDDGSDNVEIKMNENFIQTVHPELVVPVIDEKMMECTRKQQATAKQMANETEVNEVTIVEEKKVADAQPTIIEKVVEKVEKVQVSASFKKNKRAKKSTRFNNINNNIANSQQQFEPAKPSAAEHIIPDKTESPTEATAERVEEIHDEIVIVADVDTQELAEMEMQDVERNEKSDEIEIITEENLAALDVPTSPTTTIFDEAEMIEIQEVEATPEESSEISPREVDEVVAVQNEMIAGDEIVAMPPPSAPPALVELAESSITKKARRSKKNKRNNNANNCNNNNNNVDTTSDLVVTEPAPPLPMTAPPTVETDNKPTNDVIDSPIEIEIVADCFTNESDRDEIVISKEDGLEKMKLTHFYDMDEELEIDLAPLSSFDAHFADESQVDDTMTDKCENAHLKSKINEVVKNTNMIFAMCSSLKDAIEMDEDTKSTSSQSQIQRSTSSSVTTNTTTSTFASANSVQMGEGVESDYKSFEIDADILDEIKVAESEDISSIDATSSETDDASMKRSFENESKFKADDDEELRPLLHTSQNSLSSPSDENEMKNPAAPAEADDVEPTRAVVSDFPSLADANPKFIETPITLTSTVTTNSNGTRNKKNKRKRR